MTGDTTQAGTAAVERTEAGPYAGTSATVDIAYIRTLRLERDLLLRDVAAAVGLSEARWRRLEGGQAPDTLTLGQLNLLADLLAVPLTDLLTPITGPASGTCADDGLVQRLGALLYTAGRSVPEATLAAALHVTTAEVTAAATELRAALAPAGLRLRRSAAGLTLLAVRGRHRDSAVTRMLRVGDGRAGLLLGPARLLHSLARGQALIKRLKQEDRINLSVLLSGEWVVPGRGDLAGPNAVTVHPDVHFSLGLDEGWGYQPALATVNGLHNRPRLAWLPDDDHSIRDPDAGDAERPEADDSTQQEDQ